MKLKALVATAVAASTMALGAGIASATPPSNTGHDDKADTIVGSGSDTTYNFIQKSDLLYNQAQGCNTWNTYGSTSGSGDAFANCLTTAGSQDGVATKGNWDHNVVVEQYPTGSGAGINALKGGAVDFARSSRAPKSSGESALNFWAFAKDGLSVTTFGTRTPGNLTTAQLKGIYQCTITSWQDITGDPADAGKTIQPIGMNAASGTYATMNTFLGLADLNAGSCVKKLAVSNIYPFENDVKPLELPDQAGNIDPNNAIWFMSTASYKAFSYKRQDAQAWTVDGVSADAANISNNSYPITRFIYHVTKKVDAFPNGSADDVVGATVAGGVYTADTTNTVAASGKAGAVRELTRFLCNTKANHGTNDYTGLSNYDELSKVFSQTGFIRVPATERTNGVCKAVQAP